VIGYSYSEHKMNANVNANANSEMAKTYKYHICLTVLNRSFTCCSLIGVQLIVAMQTMQYSDLNILGTSGVVTRQTRHSTQYQYLLHKLESNIIQDHAHLGSQ
jgi:hypothetical protein